MLEEERDPNQRATLDLCRALSGVRDVVRVCVCVVSECQGLLIHKRRKGKSSTNRKQVKNLQCTVYAHYGGLILLLLALKLH